MTTFLFDIPACHYFDDFPHFEVEPLCKSSCHTFELFLKILGWRFAEGDKNLPFDCAFNILGARIDLTDNAAGFITVKNKPGRLDHVASLIKELKETLDFSNLAAVRGHVVFASGFCLGWFLRPAMNAVSRAFSSTGSARKSNVEEACEHLLHLIEHTRPRKISCVHDGLPILIFTDSAFEKGIATMGALVILPDGEPPLVFDGSIPQQIINKWTSSGSKQVIAQAELLTVVAMRYNLRHMLHRKKVIFFIDNEAARFALIKSVSGRSSMQSLASAFHRCDLSYECFHWIERVASQSNPADLPTRNGTDVLLKMTGGKYAGKVTIDESLLSDVLETSEEAVYFNETSEQVEFFK